jgi:hypothetical protein
MPQPDLAELKVPVALRDRAHEILAITDEACASHLDDEYTRLCRVLVARLARKRPSPLIRGDARIWAAGAIYAVGQVNFLFDRTQQPHLSAGQLADRLRVVKTTMANRAALINKTLDIGIFEPDLTRSTVLESPSSACRGASPRSASRSAARPGQESRSAGPELQLA